MINSVKILTLCLSFFLFSMHLVSQNLISFPMPICKITDKVDSIKFLIVDDIYSIVYLENKKFKSSSFYFQRSDSISKNFKIESNSGSEFELYLNGTQYGVSFKLGSDSSIKIINGIKRNNNGKYFFNGWSYAYKEHSISSKQSLYSVKKYLMQERIDHEVIFYDNNCENFMVVYWHKPLEFEIVLGKQRKTGILWRLLYKGF